MRLLIKAFVVVGASMIAAVVVWAFAGTIPVYAQESACRFNLTDTRVAMMAGEVPHTVLDWNSRDHFIAMLEAEMGFNLPLVTNVLVARLPQGVFFGLEIDGCLTPPALLFLLPPPKRSGATPAGVFA